MAATQRIQRRGQIIKIWFEHEFSINGPAVEIRHNLNEPRGRLYPIDEVDDILVKNHLTIRITEIERELMQIQGVKDYFQLIKAESEHPYDTSEFERMTKHRGTCYKDMIKIELNQVFEELEKLTSVVETEEENWDQP
jgi:hypothetical protein